jgi:anti-anti-sigma factor
VTLEVRSERRGDVVWVLLRGELDIATVELADRVLDRAVPAAAALTLDLVDLEFIDSSGIRWVMLVDARARREGWTFAIVAGQGPARRLITTLSLDDRLPLRDPG